MKISDKLCFESILAIPAGALDESVAVYVMGEKLFFATKENQAQLINNCQPLQEGVWMVVEAWKGKMSPECKAAVTFTPSYSRTMGVAFLVQAKVYSNTYLEALACFIGHRLGASENTFYHIAQSQLLGKVTAEDICRAALYVSLAGYGVETYTGDDTLAHVQELLGYSQQPYQVRPTADVPAGVAEQCLNLEFEELYEKALALGKEGYFLDLMMNKIDENNDKVDTNQVDLVALLDACVDQRVVADGTILKFGLRHIFHQAFMLVHENNLTKFPEDPSIAQQAAQHYTNNGTPAQVVWNQRYHDKGNYVIRRIADGKFLKPLDYKGPNLEPLVNNELVTHLRSIPQNEKVSSETPV